MKYNCKNSKIFDLILNNSKVQVNRDSNANSTNNNNLQKLTTNKAIVEARNHVVS